MKQAEIKVGVVYDHIGTTGTVSTKKVLYIDYMTPRGRSRVKHMTLLGRHCGEKKWSFLRGFAGWAHRVVPSAVEEPPDAPVRPPFPISKLEAVDHPDHYGGENNQYEAIKIITGLGHGESFCLGNVIKYLIRAEKKGTEVEDLKKALWYLKRHMALKGIETDPTQET